jgi:hypothetical protein
MAKRHSVLSRANRGVFPREGSRRGRAPSPAGTRTALKRRIRPELIYASRARSPISRPRGPSAAIMSPKPYCTGRRRRSRGLNGWLAGEPNRRATTTVSEGNPMLINRAVSVIVLGLLAVAPASAATTYAWPLQVSQKVTLTNVTVPGVTAGSPGAVNCIMAPSASSSQIISSATTYFTATTTSGVWSYAGTATVPLPSRGSAVPPQSGSLITCWVDLGATIVPGSTVSYTLP